ncbi:MAG TPA: hypothetical protein VN721_14165 [Flavipsychrobacter sp.]|nr:hypothetical protein [Flavipsychrobacter sp.]
MKKYMILFLSVITLLAACKKEHGAMVCGSNHSDFHPDYFVFGKNQGNCMCNMVGIAYYMVNDNKLYSEYIPDDIFRKTGVMPDSDYIKVRVLMDQFPAYLLSHPNSSFGCTSCGDFSDVINIIAVWGTDTVSWHIEPNATTLPVEIQPYTSRMQQTWRALWP